MTTESSERTRRLVCFGFGYSARAFAGLVGSRGWRVAGTTRGADKLRLMTEAGVEGHLFERGHPLAEPALEGTTHLLVSVPPDEAGDPVLDHHGEGIAALPSLEWVGYLSTTGVYGDTGGDWVDETSPLRPTAARLVRRAEAEARWLALWRERGASVHVFRLAGIYGPGRSTLDQVRSRRARRIVRPGYLFSRIHVDDIARVLLASVARPDAGAIYNLCDDEPATQAEVIEYACRLLGVAPPAPVPFEQAASEMSAMARSFWADNRRVSNGRIKLELGVRFRFPNYRAGLEAILEAERR